MDGAEVGVLKETHQVRLASLLESHHSRALEPQVSLEVLGNLTDETLEGQLADEQFSGLLVPSDLTESNGARPVAVGLLHTSSGRGGLPGSFSGKLFPGSFASSCLASSLLSSRHCNIWWMLGKLM